MESNQGLQKYHSQIFRIAQKKAKLLSTKKVVRRLSVVYDLRTPRKEQISLKKGERETVEKDKKSIKATENEKIPSLKEKEECILLN